MAGIGFELRRLTQRDDLMGVVQGYLHSALVSSGPWLFTVLSIAAINMFSGSWASLSELADFRIAIIYSFSFSLVLTGPVMLVATRYLADQIYGASVKQAPGMMLGARRLPGKWIGPLNDSIKSALVGFQDSRISDLARRTVALRLG